MRTAAVVASETAVTLPAWSKWLLASAFGLYFFIQLQGQIRYSRQTVDELHGPDNKKGAVLKYIWAAAATLWVMLLAAGTSHSFWGSLILIVVLLAGACALGLGTRAYEHKRRELHNENPELYKESSKLAWLGTIVAIATGVSLTVVSLLAANYGPAFVSAVIAAGLLSLYSLILPSIGLYRTHKDFSERESKRVEP